MDLKKLDIKSIFIIILSLGLVVSFMLGQKNRIDYKKDEIKSLNKQNEDLGRKNDSILLVNKALDKQMSEINKQIQASEKLLAETESQLNNLKQRRNETSNRVTNLSANGVTSGLSNYVKKHRKN